MCLEFDSYDDDQIVICSHCNVAVHQSCHGGSLIDNIPAGDWYCDRCVRLIKNPQMKASEIKCFLCD